jgi:Asp-tRNA(Asn)/Glu-tRNA(Gln) amidotransferase A subunit family amidase
MKKGDRMRKRWQTTVMMLGFMIAGVVIGVTAQEVGITSDVVQSAARVMGMEFSPVEIDSMLDDLNDYADGYAKLREFEIENHVPPAFNFNPLPVGDELENGDGEIRLSLPRQVTVPENMEELAFYSVRDLAALVKNRKITSTALTRMYLERLKRFGGELECVITLTENLALKQARRADEEIAAGRYRGPLHGIPYGAKDLLAVKGYKTTWGAEPYKDQVIDETATVIQKLEDAGAVLVAKLTLGALAWGDVWYGGKTRNPWNLEEGSSGSSAGSASATSAGLVAFAIGTETWGSIVSPSTRCGTTGLRPTYGRVSRTGAMALSWTMDKIGPICRAVEDCAIVFDAIIGPDGVDQTLVDTPFSYSADVDLSQLRIGYVKAAFDADYSFKDTDAATLAKLRELGATLVPIELPQYPSEVMPIVLTAEAAAAFDGLTRSGRDDMLVRQIKNAWPNVFRSSRLIPAVEYIQANRVRHSLIQDMKRLMETVDVYVSPSFGGGNLLLTNLTSHPCVVLPNGFNEEGSPVSITFMGDLYEEGLVLAVANAYQRATDFHLTHPSRFQ